MLSLATLVDIFVTALSVHVTEVSSSISKLFNQESGLTDTIVSLLSEVADLKHQLQWREKNQTCPPVTTHAGITYDSEGCYQW